MIGDFLTRGLVMVFGYAYPAYECFKTVEKNKPEIEQLQFWCQYWILIAMLTIFERIGDNFVSWVPMYSEAKLAFVILLWYPKTKGTTYVYDSFFKPYMAKHETEIDRNLQELRNRAGKMAFISFQKVASYGQTRIFEVLQYIAAQSAPTPRPAQPGQPAPGAHQPPADIAAALQPSTGSQNTQPHNEGSPSSTSSASSSLPENEVRPEVNSTLGLNASTSAPAASVQALLAATAFVKKAVSMSATPESSSQSASNDVEEMQIEPVPGIAEEAVPDDPTPPQETVIEEVIRVTRGRLRKTLATVTK